MTAKRSPLDFIINDSAARRDSHEGQRIFSSAADKPPHTERPGPTTGGTFQEQTGESAIKGIPIATCLF